MGWRAWFDNGLTYDSRSTSWADVPDDGCQVRMLFFADGSKQVQHGADYYYDAPHPAGTIHGSTSDLLHELQARYPGAIVKRGRWAPDDWYHDIMAEAHASTW